MQAIINVPEELIGSLQKMGVEIVCTEEDAIIVPPFTDLYILDVIDHVLESHNFTDSSKNKELQKILLPHVKEKLVSSLEQGENPGYDDLRDYIDQYLTMHRKKHSLEQHSSR